MSDSTDAEPKVRGTFRARKPAPMGTLPKGMVWKEVSFNVTIPNVGKVNIRADVPQAETLTAAVSYVGGEMEAKRILNDRGIAWPATTGSASDTLRKRGESAWGKAKEWQDLVDEVVESVRTYIPGERSRGESRVKFLERIAAQMSAGEKLSPEDQARLASGK